MLSKIIASIMAFFFLFLASGFFWAMVTTGGKGGGWYLTALTLTIISLIVAWGAAALGDI